MRIAGGCGGDLIAARHLYGSRCLIILLMYCSLCPYKTQHLILILQHELGIKGIKICSRYRLSLACIFQSRRIYGHLFALCVYVL